MARRFSRSRRDVVKAGALGVVGCAAGGFAGRRLAQQSEEMVDPSSPVAQSLTYVEDAAEAPADLRDENEYCYNCQYFRSDQETGTAPCTILMNLHVPAGAWCNVWVLKTDA